MKRYISKEDRQYHGQKKEYKKTNNDLQNTTKNTKGVHSSAPEGQEFLPSNGTRRVTLVTKPGERPGLRLRQTGHILVICDINTP